MELSREDMMQAISDGVRQAFQDALGEVGIGYLIEEGVKKAFDPGLFPSEIKEAILIGVREAHKR